MTQTLEPGTRASTAKGKRTDGEGPQTTNAEHRSLGIGVLASESATAPRLSSWWDDLRIQQIAGTGTALLSAGLSPALVMVALWHTADIAPLIFTFTFVIALGHAVLLGLPFRSMSWINLTTCVVVGFAVGAAPVGALTWPMQHPELHMTASVAGVLMIINEAITTIGWTSYIKPLIYFGSFGALGGFAFWGCSEMVRHLRV